MTFYRGIDMNADSINKWLTLGANLGVLMGITLVAYEINQATVTTRAEMISSYQDRWVTIDLSWQSEDLASAWAKAIESPEDLTLTEMIQLNGFMWSYIDHVSTNRLLWDLGVFEEPQGTIEDIYLTNAALFFGNKFTQSWLAENRVELNPRTTAAIDRALETVATGQNLDFYKRIKTRIGE